MNSDDGVKTNAGKNRCKRIKKASKDTEEIGDKMKSITIVDVENHTGVKTNVGKNRRNRQTKTSKDTEDNMKPIVFADVKSHTDQCWKNRRNRRKKASKDTEEIGDKMKSITIADVENHTGKKRASNDDDSYDSDESWGHDHSKCIERLELLSGKRRRDKDVLLQAHFDALLNKWKADTSVWDVEEMKRLEEEADRLVMEIKLDPQCYPNTL